MLARRVAPSVRCPGIHLDSLGHYLAAIGLLRIATTQWSFVRGAWREDVFYLIDGPTTTTELSEGIGMAVRQDKHIRYERDWMDAQGRDRGKGSFNTQMWRSQCPENACEVLDAHIVPVNRLVFNPLLGTGGNSGRREFSTGHKEALATIKAATGTARQRLDEDLVRLLSGQPCAVLDHWHGGSWFSQWITPWAMVLACEGLPMLAGRASRRLGAQTRRHGAFPYCTEAAAPVHENEAGRVLAELWAPVWSRPMTYAELTGLFARGRAELMGKGAAHAAAFAAAITRRGVDAGVTEFRRFLLNRTTSSQTFESTVSTALRVPSTTLAEAAEATGRVVQLRDRLPADEVKNDKIVYRGLRGSIDESLIAVAARPSDVDSGWSLLDAISAALDKVDVNQGYRSLSLRLPLLNTSWLTSLSALRSLPAEGLIAMAVCSVQPLERRAGSKKDGLAGFLSYRLGVKLKADWLEFPKEAPARRVWSARGVQENLAAVLRRRLYELDATDHGGAACRGAIAAPFASVVALLLGALQPADLDRWISRMMLFDWRQPDRELLSAQDNRSGGMVDVVDGRLALYGLLKPLFHAGAPIRVRCGRRLEPLFEPGTNPAPPAALAQIAALLEAGEVQAAVDEAFRRYRVGGRFPSRVPVPLACPDSMSLLAALLIPTTAHEIGELAQRWLPPVRMKENDV